MVASIAFTDVVILHPYRGSALGTVFRKTAFLACDPAMGTPGTDVYLSCGHRTFVRHPVNGVAATHRNHFHIPLAPI
ncbi:hypothetical protein MMALV_06400 [Candidatus Methanomethylophilus alvi Mx1201]|uniref:Uncharacterized protein n=1 Tax=Methanomethylophilus alvi (strain Mx1201) TaxID=1236689 RepID=M9SC95_METAX|nr:hypothetical protein MMALV_06400 [Candidatus Methanomethylophilus alvi Mx1201]